MVIELQENDRLLLVVQESQLQLADCLAVHLEVLGLQEGMWEVVLLEVLVLGAAVVLEMQRVAAARPVWRLVALEVHL